MRALLCCMLACLACAGSEPLSTEPPPRFPVASPELRDAVVLREYAAEIRATRHAELRSRLKGVIEVVSVDEGHPVRAGQTLFSVNARTLEQQVLVARAATLGAEAEAKAAALDLQNTRLLQENNVVSAAELALVESKVQTLRARVEEAKATATRAMVELQLAEVKAPFDGVANRIRHRTGSAIGEDELLTTVTDNREVFAYFRISEREHMEYSNAAASKPAKVSLKLVDGSRFPVEGVIDAIESEFERETGTLAYRARFANPNGVLKHGSSGKVILSADLRQALLVPQKATFEVQGDVYVYALDASNVPHARKLTIKARVGDAFAVEKGIDRGELFVLEGAQKIREGARIEVVHPTAAVTATDHGG